MTRQTTNTITDDLDEATSLDLVFFALSDGIRRDILQRVGAQTLTVSEIAAPYDISLQAVSRHIQVLARAGLVRQERTGRISRCHLDAGPMYDAAIWINQYSQYWQAQFDTLKGWIEDIDRRKLKQSKNRTGEKQ